jgi:hypothetical protein
LRAGYGKRKKVAGGGAEESNIMWFSLRQILFGLRNKENQIDDESSTYGKHEKCKEVTWKSQVSL